MTPHQRKISAIVSRLLDWFAQNARDLPWRRTRDPYAIWVSEIMLQQTQVKTVIPFWNRWMRELPTIESVARARADKIHKLWEGLGYYNRVRNLQRAAKLIVISGKQNAESENGPNGSRVRSPHLFKSGKAVCRFPEKFDDVFALPGIGRYTAGAICSIAFNQPTPILDGNVIRVLTRIFGIGDDPKQKEGNARLWKFAEELVIRASSPKPRAQELNESLMELGALVCTPRNPQCAICPAKKLCVAFREERIGELPNLGKREKATARRFTAFVGESNGRFLVRQRPGGVVNAHLWEFPNVEVFNGEFDGKAVAKGIFGIAPTRIERFSTVKHSITRYSITLDGCRVWFGKRPVLRTGVWKSPAQMERLAFTAAHKKLASHAARSILSDR